MLTKIHFCLLAILLSVGIFSAAEAQISLGNSPFSRLGLGSEGTLGSVRQAGMGGVGLATPSADFTNNLNPALLPFNRLVNIEVKFTAQRLWLRDNQNKALSGGGGPAAFFLTLPLGKKVTLGASYQSYTNVGYESQYTSMVNNSPDTVIYGFRGSGGLSKASIGVGYNIGNGLALGLESGFLTGTITNAKEIQTFGTVSPLVTVNNDFKYSVLNLKPAISYRLKLDSSGRTLGLAAMYEVTAVGNVAADQLVTYGRRDRSLVYQIDTLKNSIPGKVTMPQKFSVGISITKPRVYTAGLDLIYSTWSNFGNYGVKQGLKNSYRLNAGLEFVPNYNSLKYASICTYRAGLSFENTPYVVNGTQLQDFSGSVGASFPILRKEAKFTRPLISLAAIGGQRGTLSTNGIQEMYFKLVVGITINDSMWFKRYREE